MSPPVRTILQVNTRDRRGGAEQVALNLHRVWRRRGLDSRLMVGERLGTDEGVVPIAGHTGRSGPYRAWRTVADRTAGVLRAIDAFRGNEAFHYPSTWRMLARDPRAPDIIHAHNLHGGYFDLRALPWLSGRAPTVLTLHDAWLLSGHCAHSFECERWRTGCGHCPDLTIYPAVRRDRTAHNWRRKRDIYAQSRLWVATPCEWLMAKVEASMLRPAIVDRRVIPNGVDLTVFRPGDREAARAGLGIERAARVLLFVASGAATNPFKDWPTLRAALERIQVNDAMRDVQLVALGENAGSGPAGDARIRFVPFTDDPAAVAAWYRAADLYVHAARADTFPNTILEALACGTPVVATAVGGIPEQVRDVAAEGPDIATGALVAAGDADGLARRTLELLEDDALRVRLGANAARDARCRFDLERQADAYHAWFEAIVEQWTAR